MNVRSLGILASLLAATCSRPATRANTSPAVPASTAPADSSNLLSVATTANPLEPEGGSLPPDVGEMLVDRPCKPKLRVALEHHVLAQEKGAYGPAPGPFLIEPGERLCLVGRPPLDDLHLSAVAVPSDQEKQALIGVELRATAIGTVLVIRNHFDRPLSYRALIKRQGHNIETTSVCTVQANLFGLEHWPEAVDLIGVGDFRLLTPDAPQQCH